jgi:hypothetical protein
MIEDSAIFDIEASVRNITETERIVIDRHIVLNGIKFDAQDIYDTLVETCSSGSDCYMTDEKMIDALKKLRIIEHGGCVIVG